MDVFYATEVASGFSNELIRIIVGSGSLEQTFFVHKTVCQRVPFFANALGQGFRESVDGEFRFPEDDREAFSLLFVFLYSGHVERIPNWEGYMWFLVFYVLAERFQLPELQNRIMRRLQSFSSETDLVNDSGTIRYVYENTSASSKLRLFLASLVAWEVAPEDKSDERLARYKDVMETTPSFAYDVLRLSSNRGYRRNKGSDDPTKDKISFLVSVSP